MFLFTVIAITFIAVIIKLYLRTQSGMCRCTTRLDSKLAIVTGANTGIGYETAKDLVSRGARVIIACRDTTRGMQAACDIAKETGKTVLFKQLDLASFKSIKNFVSDLEKEPYIDILINNAGVGRLDNSLTEDGIPVETQVNHFGPFLLTNLLLPLIKKSSQGRIIIVSSVMHKFGTLNLERLVKPACNRITHQKVYSDTKLCNLLFGLELSKRLRNTSVTVNMLHPGAVNTDIYRNIFTPLRIIIKFVMPKTPRDGAQTSIHLAVSPQLSQVTGKYFQDCVLTEPATKATDEVVASELWEFSNKIVKLNV